MEIADGVHRIETPLGERINCVYLLKGAQGSLLVDSAVDEAIGTVVLPYLDQVGVAPDDIRWVVTTHSDFDHMGGNRALRDACPRARFVCHELDRPMVEDVDLMIDERYGEFSDPHGIDDTDETKEFIRSVAHATPVDVALRGSASLDLGDRRVDVLHVPGHSWGHLAVWDAASRTAVIGDAVLGNAVPLADGAPAFPPTYRYLDTYLSSIDRLAQLRPAHLLTAHYPVMGADDGQAFLAESRNFTERVDDALRGRLADGPATMRQLCTDLVGHLGHWPPDTAQFLAYPFAGHLERLTATGAVEVDASAGPAVYRLNGVSA